MRRGISIFFGMVLIIVGLLKLLPLVGVNVIIDGFNLDTWFPVVYILIGLLELLNQEASGWFWGIVFLIYGVFKLSQIIGFAIPLINMLNIESLLIPFFVLIYGIKAIATSGE